MIDVAKARARLEAKAEHVRKEIDRTRSQTLTADGRPITEISPYDNHPGDIATDTFMEELTYGLEDDLRLTLREIEEALRRIDAGKYGRCVNCGREIPAERLEALPWTKLDIDCKRAFERLE